jgi:glycosyltransferase involved in cell wall biosynthesis
MAGTSDNPEITVMVDASIFGTGRPGGIGRYFREVLPRIPQHDPAIRFALLWPPGVPPLTAPGLTTFHVSHLRPSRFFGRFNRPLDRWRLRSVRPDIFHASYYTEPPVPARRRVLTVYDMIDEHFFDTMSGNDAGFRERLRGQIRRADHVIAISGTTRQDVIQFGGAAPENVSVCHLAADRSFGTLVAPEALAEFRARHRTGERYFVYVGHRWHYKNFGVLLEGWVRFRQRIGPGPKLVCVGPPRALDGHHLDMLVKSRLAADLVLLSDLSEEQLRCAYHGAAAFVFPSLWEGFGLPVLEAAAAGVPQVLADIPVFREVAGDAALFFDPCDPDSLAAALQEVLDAARAGELARKSAALADRYSWDAAAARHAAVYRRVARR